MTTGELTEEQQRVRGYLLSQGERYSWYELWRRVAPARLQLLDALDGVTDEQAAFIPDEGEWSIGEVAQHILKGSRGNLALVERLATGEDASSEGVEPPREPAELSIAEAREEILLSGVGLSALPLRLPEPPPLDPVAPHVFFGDLHCKAWYLFQRIQDTDHAGQITAAKAADGYPDA